MAEEDILEEEQQPVDVEVEEPTDEAVAQETETVSYTHLRAHET